MPQRQFPLAEYIEGVVRLLDRIEYNDTNFSPQERISKLRAVYAMTGRHFAESEQQEVLRKQVNQKKLDAVMRTSVQVVVYCWPMVSEDVMAAISIYFVYIVILDDSPQDPHAAMSGFATDLLNGRQQQHPFWRLMRPFLEKFLSYYGPFCSMAILRSTLDYFQGCWIETRNFQGLGGSTYFPLFLRRLNGLGGICGGSLFPKADFDEQEQFNEVTTAIAQIEPMVAFFNDLFSFYKEFDNPRDEISLITNTCAVEGIEIEEAFERLVVDTLRSSDCLLAVFENSNSPKIKSVINAFVQGYCTWHLCDPRFRMHEVYESALSVPHGEKFCQYYKYAMSIGSPSVDEWAPSGATFMKTQLGTTAIGHEASYRSDGVQMLMDGGQRHQHDGLAQEEENSKGNLIFEALIDGEWGQVHGLPDRVAV